MSDLWRRCYRGCGNFFGWGPGRGPGNGKILLTIVAIILMVSLIFNPFVLTGLALLGLFMWAIFF